MAAERIPACAIHLVGIASPKLAAAIDEALRDAEHDLPALIDQARQEATAKLRGADLRAIMGPMDAMTLESFESAVGLCNEAILAALKQPGVGDRRRTARTRSWLMVCHANAYISSWSQARGMDLAEVVRLRARGRVQ